jgi:TolB-like protein/class 3 adenylate cyclase/Tfp pilus assembly protein PilF
MERRLAAILAADIVGYSRLVREDEANTLAALKTHREELIEPKLAQYHRRIVKLMGDGLLTEFPSAVEAVQCAVEIQHMMGERAAAIPEDRRITYRMGINIGDIVVEDDDIYGDGVNVAARLEGLADPGGICIARNVYNQVKDKLDLTFEHLGEKEVKNIAEPVTVYRVVLDEKAAAIATPVVRVPLASTTLVEKAKYKLDLGDERLWHGDQPVEISNKAFQLLRLLVSNPNRLLTKDHILDAVWGDVCVSEGLIKEYIHDLRLALCDDPKQPRFIETVHGRGYRFLGGIEESNISAGVEARSKAGTQRPSLAVLPFTNLSGDPQQEYFSDGITEDIITELSRFRSLFVIARNSSFTYKGRAANVQDIGRDLDVRYVVEGSVRRADKRVRVTAQLIETATGRHVWADRYDRDLQDIFSLQDEITRTIAGAIEPELGTLERERSRLKSPESLDAWDWYQRGLWHLYQETKPSNREALRHFEQSIKLSPDFAPAHAASAYVICFDLINGYRELSKDAIEEAYQTARTAITVDEKEAIAHVVLGRIQLLRCKHEEAIAELEAAIGLNPNLADAHHGLGFALTMSGQPEEALSQFEKAISLSPYDPRVSSFYEMRAWALLIMGRHDEAARSAHMAVRKPNADLWSYATLVAVLGHLDHLDEARSALQELMKRKSDFSLAFVKRSVFYNKIPAHLDFYLDGLRKAGLS